MQSGHFGTKKLLVLKNGHIIRVWLLANIIPLLFVFIFSDQPV